MRATGAIRSLTPYNQRWCIRARVTSKPNIRTYNNNKGTRFVVHPSTLASPAPFEPRGSILSWCGSGTAGAGKIFSVDLVDDSGEIRGTGFNEACDRLYPLLEVGKVGALRWLRVASHAVFNRSIDRYPRST